MTIFETDTIYRGVEIKTISQWEISENVHLPLKIEIPSDSVDDSYRFISNVRKSDDTRE